MQTGEPIVGFHAPVHRALTDPMLLGDAKTEFDAGPGRLLENA